MLIENWLNVKFGRLMGSSRPSRKQRKLAREGRKLRVETLEPRRLLAWTFPDLTAGDTFYGNFEHPIGFNLEARGSGGNLDSPYITSNNGNPAEPEIFSGSSLPDGAAARSGDKVLEAEVKKIIGSTAGAKNDWYREEVLHRTKNGGLFNKDYWQGFSMYIPQDWVNDGGWGSLVQWRFSGPGADSVHPTLDLGFSYDHPNNGPVVGDVSVGLHGSDLTSISMDEFRGIWTDFVFHTRWSTGSDGVVEAWRRSSSTNDNYVPLFSKVTGDTAGPEYQSGFIAPQQRLGYYKSSWKAVNIPVFRSEATEQTVYWDEWRIVVGANGQDGINTTGFNTVKVPGSPSGGNSGVNGDFDSDGDTDGADFLQWQLGFGTTHTADDLTDWENHFGETSPVDEVLVNFDQATISNYNAQGSLGNTTTASNGGATLTITGDAWKSIPFNRTVTANTVIEFDFESPTEGDIHAIGFDNDDVAETNRTLRFHGTQNTVGISTVPQYTGSGVQHFKLRIGDYGAYELGNVDRLFFINDHDAAPFNAVGIFSNVRVYDEAVAVAAGTAEDFGTASKAVRVERPAFLLTTDMFSPVASQLDSDAVLDEAFVDSGKSAGSTQQSQFFELESYTSTTLSHEDTEEEDVSESSLAGSFDLALQLL